MNEILYYPLIDCDTEGTEKVAMIPSPNGNAVKSRSSMWLAEMVPHHFRLYAKSNSPATDSFSIRCPRCGKALKRISADINETTRSLFVCSTCAND